MIGLLPERHVSGVENHLEPGVRNERHERFGNGERNQVLLAMDDERGTPQGTHRARPVIAFAPEAGGDRRTGWAVNELWCEAAGDRRICEPRRREGAR